MLAGGGLPHLHCLGELARGPFAGVALTVVSPVASVVYSGMLPGFVAGHYALDECVVPIEALARAAGAAFVEGVVAGVDAGRRQVMLVDGRRLDYELLSINVGSIVDTRSIAGADHHAIPVRPLEGFARRWEVLRHELVARAGAQVVVIGAGAGGIELALAMKHAFVRSHGIRVDVVSATTALPGRSGARVERRLQAAGIGLRSGVHAVAVDAQSVTLSNGERMRADATIVATGSAAPSWIAGSGLAVDSSGYASVDSTLRVLACEGLFASGDCASIRGHPQPRSGVHALRMGPVLLENLRRSVRGAPLATYAPRQRALHLVSAGDRYAVGSWSGFAFEGRWAWRWKDRIDRAFVARHTPQRRGYGVIER